MNCDDYLAMLSTVSVDEVLNGPAREHAATCRDCNRVTRVVAERERNMVAVYGGLDSSKSVAEITSNAISASRRRMVTFYYRLALGLAVAATIVALVLSRAVPAKPQAATVRETFRLQCLSPEQAAEMLRGVVGPDARMSSRSTSPLGLITVDAPPPGIAAARALLDRYDNPAQAQCAVQVKVPKVPTVP